MPLAKKGKVDNFAEIAAEAEEAEITLTRQGGGYAATFAAADGEIEWTGDNARAVLDDALALQAMEEDAETFEYEEDGLGGARVKVKGIRGHFDDPTFAGAYAKAQEAVLASKAQAEPPKAKRAQRAPQAVSEPTPEPEPTPTPEPEFLAPTKPNGRTDEKILGDSDTLRVLAEHFNKLSETYKSLADAMQRDEALVPFMGSNFSEDEVPAGKSRVRRERGK